MGFDLTLTLWVLIGGAMILFMHGGFCMLEAGFIPVSYTHLETK